MRQWEVTLSKETDSISLSIFFPSERTELQNKSARLGLNIRTFHEETWRRAALFEVMVGIPWKAKLEEAGGEFGAFWSILIKWLRRFAPFLEVYWTDDVKNHSISRVHFGLLSLPYFRVGWQKILTSGLGDWNTYTPTIKW